MKLKVMYTEDKFTAFSLVDDITGEKVGILYANDLATDHLPKVEAMTRFQGAKLVLDGKSLKRLQKEVREHNGEL